MSEDYQTIYGVGILDDIHNYFPRLLYNPEEFRTVNDVMVYVQNNIQRRFNLFSYGRRQYMASLPPETGRVAREPENTIRYNMSEIGQTSISTLLPLLQRLATPRVVRVPIHTQFQDVIVHASQELINSASTEHILGQDTEDSCNICQDNMSQGDSIRTLLCQHSYHRACIDNWLLNQSVLCPTCRHDVREPYVRPPSRRTTPALGPSQPVQNAGAPDLNLNPDPTDTQTAEAAEAADAVPEAAEAMHTAQLRITADEVRSLLTRELWNTIFY
jgi:hypothetical protein